MAVVIGEDPRPRALLCGVEKAHLSSIRKCFPIGKVVTSLDAVVLDEWDLIVSDGTDFEVPRDLAEHLSVIHFGPGPLVPPANTDGFKVARNPSLGRWYRSPARELEVPEDLPAPISQLVHADLAPAASTAAREKEGNTVIIEGFGKSNCQDPAEIAAIRPFLYTKHGRFAIAGLWKRMSGAEVWSLPDTVNRASWIRAALEIWSEHDPARFPRAKWKTMPAWATPDETKLRARQAELTAARDAVITGYEAQLLEVATEMEKAIVAADAGLRALLVSQGDALVHAVEHFFREVGFEVRNMDLETSETDRLEDLRVKLPGSEWTAIVEVRGYKGGASVKDLMRIERFATRFAVETRRAPEARWYVVNQLVGRDPTERRPPLNQNPEEVKLFAEAGGLVVDTAEIFRLARAIVLESLPLETVRKLFIEGRGVVVAPAKG